MPAMSAFNRLPPLPPIAISTGGPNHGDNIVARLDKMLSARMVAYDRSEISTSAQGTPIDPLAGANSLVGHLLWLKGEGRLSINSGIEILGPGKDDPVADGSLSEDISFNGQPEESRALIIVLEDHRIFELDPRATVLRGTPLDTLPTAVLQSVGGDTDILAALVNDSGERSGDRHGVVTAPSHGRDIFSQIDEVQAIVRSWVSGKERVADHMVEVATLAHMLRRIAEADPEVSKLATAMVSSLQGILDADRQLRKDDGAQGDSIYADLRIAQEKIVNEFVDIIYRRIGALRDALRAARE